MRLSADRENPKFDSDRVFDFMALGIWSQFILTRISDTSDAQDITYAEDGTPWPEHSQLNDRLLNALVNAAASPDPASIIQDSLIVDHVSAYVHSGPHSAAGVAWTVHRRLSAIIRKADTVIENALKEKPGCRLLKLTAAHCLAPYNNYFTNFEIMGTDRPWRSWYGWCSFDTVPALVLQPASPDWQKAVGIHEMDSSVD